VNELAPAKINLCLYLGPTRADRRHELVSVMQPLAFGDDVLVQAADRDEVVCAGIDGPNLAATALRAFRDAVGGPPLRLTITKRTPVAAGMAGGSADAGAALRVAAQAAGVDDDGLLLRLAEGLGADVPAQIRPARVLATGAGERLAPLGPPPRFGVLVLPSRVRLSTADVYAEADRLGLAREHSDLAACLDAVRAGLDRGPFGLAEELLVNDLESAARSLAPSIDRELDVVRELGAAHALVAGSGPTVIGLFAEPSEARRAAAALAERTPTAIATEPLAAIT
jgi:4-diphosphocytidyl-2-C-methyl-D-erythritol kinase